MKSLKIWFQDIPIYTEYLWKWETTHLYSINHTFSIFPKEISCKLFKWFYSKNNKSFVLFLLKTVNIAIVPETRKILIFNFKSKYQSLNPHNNNKLTHTLLQIVLGRTQIYLRLSFMLLQQTMRFLCCTRSLQSAPVVNDDEATAAADDSDVASSNYLYIKFTFFWNGWRLSFYMYSVWYWNDMVKV